MRESNVATYRIELSSMPSATIGAKSGVRITAEVIDIPVEQHVAVRDALNEFCAKVSSLVDKERLR